MIGKPALALLAAPLLLSNSPETAPVYVDYPEIRQVLCDDSAGSAFRVGAGAFVTAWHVASSAGCKIDGEPIDIVHKDEAHDFVILRTQVLGGGLRIDCGGFVDGEGYAGVGYSHGGDKQEVIAVVSMAGLSALDVWMQFTNLWGARFIPGQSGGPVLNKNGEVVGVVYGYNTAAPLSYSQALKDTILCQGSASARQ
jgi:hypothetical protein